MAKKVLDGGLFKGGGLFQNLRFIGALTEIYCQKDGKNIIQTVHNRGVNSVYCHSEGQKQTDVCKDEKGYLDWFQFCNFSNLKHNIIWIKK